MMTFSKEISKINQQKLLNHGKIFFLSSLVSFPFSEEKKSTVEGLKYH